VQRYAAGREREAVAFIERMIKTVNSRLASDITDFSRGRLESILFDLEQYAKETLASYSEKTVEEALKFAQYEIGFNERLLGQNISASLTLPAPNQVSAGIFSSVMNVEPRRGYTIEQALKAFEGKKSSQIVDTIRSGVILGDTREQITSALVRMGDLQKQQAATLTRTITNHVSTEARSLFMEENEDVLEGYEWVATLDSRTSLVCSSRDGTVYPFTNDPIRSPKPPAHFSCRSTIVPKVKDEFDLTGGRVGVRPAIGADGVEQVRGSTDYQSWLTRQPKAFQVEVLGKERAELFRRGDLKLTNFVDSAGETISLNRLRELEPLAFQKAGVELPVIVPRSATVAPVVQQSNIDLPIFDPAKVTGSVSAKDAETILRERLTPTMLLAVQKAQRPSLTSTLSKSGFYRTSSKQLYSPKITRKNAVFSHEYGHHIDYELNEKANSRFRASNQNELIRPRSSVDSEFASAFMKDRTNIFGDSYDEFLNSYKQKYFEEYKKTASSRFTYTRSKSYAIGDFENTITDIFDAMLSGVSFDTYHMPGHGRRYYNNWKNQATETFANLFALKNDKTEIGERAKTLFPNLFKRFDEMLEEYVKGDYD
jgi:SPP1 gp7 family putative phage head morphogenesis protein